MIEIPEKILEKSRNYHKKVASYKNGETDAMRFKAYRVSMGIYEQRETNTYMLRTRIPGGVVTLPQLKKINDLAETYANGSIHFTTRQDIQFHRVSLDNTIRIIEELLPVGIITCGTGGNTVRNIACSPLSGVDINEIFDVTPHMEAATSYLLKDEGAFNLPRKFKIAFSNTPSDSANATIADLGFVAKEQNGVRGFEVYGGGGFGTLSRISLKLEDFIPETDILYYVQAMKELFEKEGDRSNKNRARIRHIVDRLGESLFIKTFKDQVQKVRLKKDLSISFSENLDAAIKPPEDIKPIESNILFPQKQRNLYSVYIHPQNGTISTRDLKTLLLLIDSLSYPVSFRVTSTQGLVVRDIKNKDTATFLELIRKFASSFDVDNSIACAGAATCKLGLCLSQNLLTAISKRFEDANDNIKSQLPRIFISGCPNSCGQHYKGQIGLSGKARRTADGLIPMYTVFFGGNVGSNSARLAESYGDIPAKKIPDFLFNLALLKNNCCVKDFHLFLKDHNDSIKDLIDKYSTTDSKQDNPDLYFDFGSQGEFSLKGRGPGECSAGVLDVIKLDLSNADNELSNYKNTKNSLHLYNAVIASSRSLLILKGIDNTKDREILEAFVDNYVKPGYLKESIVMLKDILIDFRLGDISDLSSYESDLIYWISRVKAMYDSLNPQLEITLQKEICTSSDVNTPDTDDNQSSQQSINDLRGVKCPLNYAKAKVILFSKTPGQVVEFYLDDGSPINNVPRSLEGDGHEILEIDDKYPGYNLLRVRKK